MKPLITLSIILAAAYVVARPSATPSPVAAPTTPVAPVETSNVSDTPTVDEAEPGVVWFTDRSQALQSARDTGKRLLVRFTAPWCIPCANHASTDPGRQVILKNFVLLKVNVDEQPAWKINGVPVLKAKGIPYEAIYETDMRPVWAGNPLRTSRYVERLRAFGMRSVLRGHPRNPACKCNPCLCGDSCQCGKAQAPVANPLPGRTYRRACRSCR
jgi:hypothetical protein